MSNGTGAARARQAGWDPDSEPHAGGAESRGQGMEFIIQCGAFPRVEGVLVIVGGPQD